MYRFKEEYRDVEIVIPSKRLRINRFNINDDIAQLILKKFPKFAHNLELIDDDAPAVVDLPVSKLGKVLDTAPPEEKIIDPLDETTTEIDTTEEESLPEEKQEKKKRPSTRRRTKQ